MIDLLGFIIMLVIMFALGFRAGYSYKVWKDFQKEVDDEVRETKRQ